MFVTGHCWSLSLLPAEDGTALLWATGPPPHSWEPRQAGLSLAQVLVPLG